MPGVDPGRAGLGTADTAALVTRYDGRTWRVACKSLSEGVVAGDLLDTEDVAVGRAEGLQGVNRTILGVVRAA